MLRRLVNYIGRLRRVPSRMDGVAVQMDGIAGRIDALDRAIGDLRQELAKASTREHTDAAVVAVQLATLAAAHEHTEAAVAAAQRNIVSIARQHAEASASASASEARLVAQHHAEALSTQARDEWLAAVAELRRELRTLERLSSQQHRPDVSGQIERAGEPGIDPAFYVALEDRFRGTIEEISDRQRVYLEIVASTVDDDHPVLDLGCGRGEWLRLVRDAGMRGIGVDNNAAFVSELVDDGLDVVAVDLLDHIGNSADGSAGAITLFQVVEHLPIPNVLRLFDEAGRVLRPGGVLIAETPNALNLRVAATNFWLDPSHVRPLHPDLLRFCARQAGFSRSDGMFVNDLDPGYRAIEDPTIRRLVECLDGPGDFALLAWR